MKRLRCICSMPVVCLLFVPGLLLACVLAGVACSQESDAPRELPSVRRPIPVILDTDIGDDIDDTWALGLLLRSPEFDLRLVVGDQGKPDYRARLIAKFLQTAGRTDVPVGVGLAVNRSGEGPQAAWIADYRLSDYPGKVHADGVGALIETIMQADQPVTLIAIGPVPNIAAALERQPAIARRARLVGMHGSVRLGYDGRSEISAEYNVVGDAPACRQAFSAPWEITITPLDTCGLVHLTGDKYARVRDSQNPVAKAIIENYRLWSAPQTRPGQPSAADSRSSTLFDTVAVYLAMSQQLLRMEPLPIRVTDDGYTRIDQGGKVMQVATQWKDLGAFEDLLVSRLTSSDK